MSHVKLDQTNSSTEIWWSETRGQWHWRLVWDDGRPYGKHMHSGTAPSEDKAAYDINRTVTWIEETWPNQEYFQGA
jgi:hypothetical protein